MYRHSCLIVCIVLLIAVASSCSFAEIQVNQRTSQDQKACQIATLTNLGYVAVWSSYLHDGDSGAIVARYLDANGIPAGDEFVVNQVTTGNQSEPSVAACDANTILFVWRSQSTDVNDDIAARLFNTQGTPLTNEFIINEHTTGSQNLPRAAACSNDLFAITWETDSLEGYKEKAICLRFINQEGQPTTNEIIASDTPQYNCRYGHLSANNKGDIAIVWLEDRTSDAVKLRWFNNEGTPKGPAEKVNTENFKSLTWPNASMNSQGNLVVVWDGHPDKSSEDNIHARIYDPNGSPTGDAFQVNTQHTGTQRNPAVALADDGSFTIAWDSEVAGNEQDIMACKFNLSGNLIENEHTVNQTLDEDQVNPTVSISPSGTTLITWQSKNQDGSGWGVYAKTEAILTSD